MGKITYIETKGTKVTVSMDSTDAAAAMAAFLGNLRAMVDGVYKEAVTLFYETSEPDPPKEKGKPALPPNSVEPLKALGQAFTDLGIKGDTDGSKALKLRWSKYITGLSSLGASSFTDDKIADVIRSLHIIRAEVPKKYWKELPESMNAAITMGMDVKTMVEGFQLKAKEEALKAGE